MASPGPSAEPPAAVTARRWSAAGVESRCRDDRKLVPGIAHACALSAGAPSVSGRSLMAGE
ncbi:hypothetical protein IscW_ISCW017150 [Ixodes scapularis]|uniref:Uncharacterized protein n=1 Tax=Ixodes scapularis TaxID=6945 RepID=B7PAA6_IXOSC|nr:hypothetical protein IscW_ISCW017150 [Ixodes scapularis]|eukprot:XP_002406675.1 hypothetical protein IscW_ISCW017150 [Ixodes scapularis]